ncbi:MAG: hypothetical protein IKE52_03240 [Mogibacterium sp.]|nr:hypothetical protein [Mogibacterium sp.]
METALKKKGKPFGFYVCALGFWPIAVFFAQKVYPTIYDFLATKDFTMGYGSCGAIVIVFGAILWAFSKKLDEWSEEE